MKYELGIMNKRMFTIFFSLTLFFAAHFVQAAELRYFEFGPDVSTTFHITSGVIPYQFFKPYDDYISGFDIWVHNAGSAGSVSFGLRDASDTLLASKTITIPTLAPVWGGTKVHVVFDTPIHVTSANTYKIRIVTSMPSLYLYYARLTELRQHDAGDALSIQVLPAYLNSSDQLYAFKFALYEDSDASAPLLSDVTSTLISSEQVRFSFHANEPVDASVLFGLIDQTFTEETPFANRYILCPSGGTFCSVTISILPTISYAYRLMVRDVWGNTQYVDGTLGSSVVVASSTPPLPTSTPPIIPSLAITNSRVTNITGNSATIAWTTTIPANSSILVSINDYLGFRAITSVGDSTQELEHAISTGPILLSGTHYFVSISSFDSSGNYAGGDVDFIAQTSSTPPVTPPPVLPPPILPPAPIPTSTPSVPSDTPPPSVVNEGGAPALQWEPSSLGVSSGGYRVDVFDESGVLRGQFFTSSSLYRVSLASLPAGTYRAIVYAVDGEGVFTKVAPPAPVVISASYSRPNSFWSDLTFYLEVFVGVVGTFLITFFGWRFLRRRHADTI